MDVVPDNAQHIGTREVQQDAFGFSDLQESSLTRSIGALGVVADGMGGMQQGEEMSRLACRTMIDAYTRKPADEPIAEALTRALHSANAAVLQRALELKSSGKSGTTLVAAVVHADGLHWASVGDSRIYLFRRGTLTQLTVDHGYDRHLDRKVAAGEITPEAAKEHPERHALTSFLGLEALEEVDRSVRPFPLEPGDRVLLCTDGLHGALSDGDICATLGRHGRGAAQALVDAVLARGRASADNVTATLLDYRFDGAKSLTVASPPGAAAAEGRRDRRRVGPLKIATLLVLLPLLLVGGVMIGASAYGGDGPLALRARRIVDAVGGWATGWFDASRATAPPSDQPAAGDPTEPPSSDAAVPPGSGSGRDISLPAAEAEPPSPDATPAPAKTPDGAPGPAKGPDTAAKTPSPSSAFRRQADPEAPLTPVAPARPEDQPDKTEETR